MVKDQNILLLSAMHYSFTDEKTGVLKEGTSIQYCLPTQENGERQLFGHRVSKSSIDKKIVLTKFPGIYSVNWDIVPTSKGVTLKISDLTLIKGIELEFK